jgi:uncharacterized damage-inducible protein DinB
MEKIDCPMLSNSQLFRLKYQLEALSQIINRIPPDRMGRQLMPGKWSMKENIVHLLRYQEETINRIHLILTEQDPPIDRYISEDDNLFPIACSRPLPEILNELQVTRKRLEEFIISIQDEKLARTGTHPVLGRMALTEWVEFFLLHEAHHLMTIFKIAHS